MTVLSTLKKIESRRLILRPVCLQDAEPLYILEHLGHTKIVSDQKRRGLLENLQGDVLSWLLGSGTVFRLVFLYKKNSKIIGSGSFIKQTASERYEMRFKMDNRFKSKRFLEEAINLLSRYIIEKLKAQEVFIRGGKSPMPKNSTTRFLNSRFQKITEIYNANNAKKTIYRYVLKSIKTLPRVLYNVENAPEMSEETRMLQWAVDELAKKDILIDRYGSRVVAQTPWSLVVFFKGANQGNYYFKIAAKGLGDEAKILQYLRNQHQQNVPFVLLENQQTGAFVTQELGTNLRALLKQHEGVHFLEKAALDFACLQKKTAVDLIALQQIGVPDWSLNKLPLLSAQLFNDKSLLISDGLTEHEYTKLRAVQARVEQVCTELLADQIPMTLVQCDFHDNNIVAEIEVDKVGFIDLGEVVISHPFFSMLTFIKQIRRHHPGLLSENQLDGLYKKYEECWIFKKPQTFQKKIDFMWLIFEALGQYRLFQCCSREKLRNRQKGKLGLAVREMINKDIGFKKNSFIS